MSKINDPYIFHLALEKAVQITLRVRRRKKIIECKPMKLIINTQLQKLIKPKPGSLKRLIKFIKLKLD